MSRIFLGKPIHWALVVALVAIGWFFGRQRLHVIEFNLYTIALILAAAGAVVMVLATTRPGDRVTRDRIEPGEEDP